MKNTVAAVDFGTSKIVALVAVTGGRQSCDIISAGTSTYEGYVNGRWISPDTLNEAISTAIREAESQPKERIRSVRVGVPSGFCRVRTTEAKVELQGSDPQVRPEDVDKLIERATEQLGNVNGTIIQKSPAWFVIDDGKKTMEPTGVRGYELRGMVAFIIADSYFMEDVTNRFNALDIQVEGFVSSVYGQAMLFVPQEERDRIAVLVDIGYLTTDVMIVEGEAITYLKSIPMGGADIAVDLSTGLNIQFSSAEQIKRAYVYGLSAGQPSFDALDENNAAVTLARDQVERVLEPRAEEICEAVRNAIAESGVNLSKWSWVYLTGGGLAINRGGRDFLSAKLGRPVKDLPKKAVKLSSPAYSSALGLLDLLVSSAANERDSTGITGFFRNLFGA